MAENQAKKDDFFFRPSRHVLILRRNLVASSALVLMALLFDVEIKPDQILGGAITGLTEWEIHCAAFILLLYFMGHFIGSYLNESREWELQSIEWSSAPEDVGTPEEIPYFRGPLKALKDQAYRMTQKKSTHHGNIKNRLKALQKYIHTIERSWKLQLGGFEFLLPIGMGAIAMAWLGYLIIA